MPVYHQGLRRVNHSLRQFVEHGTDLWEDHPNNPEPFVNFALTGTFSQEGTTLQAFVDPIQNIVPPQYDLSISRDYDSVLGIASDLLVEDNISVFTVPHPTYALKSGVHITYPVSFGDIERDVDLHRIPNFEWGKFGPRHHLHIFFPGLWAPQRCKSRGSYETHERERAIWYNHGLRPAMIALLGENLAQDWPASYQTEEIRARRARGGYSWSTKIIPQDIVPFLADRIRMQLRSTNDLAQEDKDWATNFFVLHTIRGTKGMTWHLPLHQTAEVAFRQFLHDSRLSLEVLTAGDWYVDVGVEISSNEGACLQWLTATHNVIVQQALLIDDATAARITDLGSSKYSRDYSSHLTAISGFRIAPGVLGGGAFSARYIQAYTTDKSIVYNNDDGHHAKFLTTREAMALEQPTPTISGLHTIYDRAMTFNGSNARLEVRVPFFWATRALTAFDPDILRRCLCIFTRREWWSFRIIRLQAASSVISWQVAGPPQLRVHDQALTLTAACVWLINGLHARPEDGPAAKKLMDAALPLSEADEVARDDLAYRRSLPQRRVISRSDREEGDEDEEEVPDEEEEEEEEEGNARHLIAHNANGCVFFRRIKFTDAPRFRAGGPTMPNEAFRFWFRMTIEEIEAKYVKTGIVDKQVIARIRSTLCKRPLPRVVNWSDEPLPDMFNIGAPGQKLPPPAYDDGSDIDDAGTPPPQLTVNAFASELFRNFVANVKSKSPNPRGNTKASYLKINNVERLSSDEAIFKNLALSDTFRHVAYKHATKDEWKRAFEWLFPKRGYETSSAVQNYPACPYFQQWLKFVNSDENSEQLVNETRMAIWTRLKTWSWIPDARQDKMWPTGAAPGFHRLPALSKPNGAPLPAPRILLRGAKARVSFVEDEE
ncbi:hypothetical protein J132_02620 [Termitomyces sp. J132]|nr:hypothetical protein H2248_006998 [Termitomyces sp. 'cryptogamus']KNZ72618.1 hypothetical protein J132_02620 [Termitomyces sp. J132]